MLQMFSIDSNCLLCRVITTMMTVIPKTRGRITTILQATQGQSTYTGAVKKDMEVNVPISLEMVGTKMGVIAFAV